MKPPGCLCPGMFVSGDHSLNNYLYIGIPTLNFKPFFCPRFGIRVSCFEQFRIYTVHRCRRFVENISIAVTGFLMHVLNNFEILYTVHRRFAVNISISVTGVLEKFLFTFKKNYPLFEKSSLL